MAASQPRTIDHVATPRRFRRLPSDSLRYIVADCRAAIDAMPSGDNVPAYLEEIAYAIAELRRREGSTVRTGPACPHCGR